MPSTEQTSSDGCQLKSNTFMPVYGCPFDKRLIRPKGRAQKQVKKHNACDFEHTPTTAQGVQPIQPHKGKAILGSQLIDRPTPWAMYGPSDQCRSSGRHTYFRGPDPTNWSSPSWPGRRRGVQSGHGLVMTILVATFHLQRKHSLVNIMAVGTATHGPSA